MKKYIIIFYLVLGILFSSSCSDYLGQAPESSGLTEEDVFTNYENFKLFFDAVYDGNKSDNLNIKTGYPLFFMLNQKSSWEGITELSDPCRFNSTHIIKGGSFGENFIQEFSYGNHLPILGAMFFAIRQSNKSLENINMLQGVQQNAVDDLIAQAYFVRAFAHFTLFKIWGPMPYIRKVIGSDDEWDIPRLSGHSTLINIAADLDTAVMYFEKANLMRRDPGPGSPGHLNDPDQFRPNGVAAKALKGRVLLYAASPLTNENGIQDWEAAAKANWEAIQLAEQYRYALLDFEQYQDNFVGAKYTNEQIWAWYAGEKNYASFDMSGIVNGIFAENKVSQSGEAPSQNAVDLFETKWGDALNTQTDRNSAVAQGHYNDQNPYVDRDPRFYIDVIYNQAPLPGYEKADIYYEIVAGEPVYGELLNQDYLGVTQTGYYNRKQWGGQSIKNQITVSITDPLIRLAELYLNYAEAANEAYGPNTPAPGASLSAVGAINVIRNRAEMPDILSKYTSSKELFRDRIKNERNVELIFEGHYYFDSRRWMDAPKTMTYGMDVMDIERVPVSETYPTGFKYKRGRIVANHQSSWHNAMYYFPFTMEDNYKMRNFVTNESW